MRQVARPAAGFVGPG